MIVLRIILIPFSLIYCLITLIRNKFYHYRIFKAHRISKPVISIGNITTGGTGKTPLSIYIAKNFLKNNKRVGIVARGYKRKSDKNVIVSDGLTINTDVEVSGDELVLIANELMKDFRGKFCIAAGKDRVEASNYLIEKFSPDVIILDDGFQNRRIERDLDIVIIDSDDYLKNKFLNSLTLPSGNLRETFSSLKRADLIIQNDKTCKINLPQLRIFNNNIIRMTYQTEYFMDFKNRILEESHYNAFVFSGIANDDSFISLITKSRINIIERIKYPDHYNYTKEDISFLIKKHTDDTVFLTTEKDFIKLKQFDNFVNDYPVYYLKLKIELPGESRVLFNKLDELVK